MTSFERASKRVLWPEGRPFALGLSHDVDRVAKHWWHFFYYVGQALIQREFAQLRRQVRSLKALLSGQDPYWNFQRITKLEESLGVRSTFFFLHESGRPKLTSPRSLVLFGGRYSLDDPRIRQVIQDLDAGGWEIGLHGSYLSCIDRKLLRWEKEKLEAIVGHAVCGVRQHYLRLDVPVTWRIQTGLGFVYDSSLGYSDRVGFRWQAHFPFYPLDPLTGERIPVLQIPLVAMDGPLMACQDPWAEALRLVDEAQTNEGVLTLNWHQRVFNPWESKIDQDIYTRIVQECRRCGAWIATLAQIAEWFHSNSTSDGDGKEDGKRLGH